MPRRFFWGVRPAGNKEHTAPVPIAPLTRQPPLVVLPLEREPGRPCVCAVSPGDTVKVGQVVGEPEGAGVPVHASVSGRVMAVEERPTPWGGVSLSVVVENDGLDTPADPIPRPDSPTPEQVVELLRAAGVADLGGGDLPACALLSAALGRADTLLLNGVESEPYVAADHRVMMDWPEKVLGGGRILMSALGLSKFTLCLGADRLEAARLLQAQGEPAAEIRLLRVRYPQGADPLLVQTVTGRRVPSGGLPTDVACALFNVHTAAAVYDAVALGKPLTHRVVTVAGRGVVHPGNLLVPLGTPLQDLVDAVGGFKRSPGRVLAGGPMTGVAQRDLSAPVTPGVTALLALTGREFFSPPAGTPTCIRCGRCAGVCPLGLAPLYLHRQLSAGQPEALEDLGVLDCIECGACAYACPTHIPLVQSIREGKAQLRRLLAQRAETERAPAPAAHTEETDPPEAPEETDTPQPEETSLPEAPEETDAPDETDETDETDAAGARTSQEEEATTP